MKNVVAEVTKVVSHELDVKSTWLARQIQTEGKNTSRQLSELGKKFEKSVADVRKECEEAVDLLVDEVNQQPTPSHSPVLPVDGDLRHRITNKRSVSPSAQSHPFKAAMLHHPHQDPALVNVTVCSSSLFNSQPSVIQAHALMGPNGQASVSPSQVMYCVLNIINYSVG